MSLSMSTIHRRLRHVRAGITGFLRHRRGVTAVTFAIALLPLLVMAGTAIDVSRAFIVKQRLGFAIDAAALAVGASTGTTAELTTLMQQYFNANYPATKLGVPATPVMTLSGKTVNITASAEVDTAFMRIVGYDKVAVEASTTVVRESVGLEVAMVLDTTGSMSGTKLSELKTAANDFVGILFGDKTVGTNLYVGVVPFSGSVNVGSADPEGLIADAGNSSSSDFAGFVAPDHSPFLDDGLTEQAWHCCSPPPPPPWNGCVLARSYPNDVQDTDIATGGGWTKLTDSDGDWNCPVAIQPLTNQRSLIESKISALSANGWTHIHFGAMWGWRVLSPTAPYTTGHAYSDPDYQKAIVIMTDGENTMPQSWDYSPYTAYRRLSDGDLGSTNQSTAESNLDSRLTEVCTNMKAEGIIVYTITFEVSSTTTQNLLRNCATDNAKYFNSPDSATLHSAFEVIATDLSNLRISD